MRFSLRRRLMALLVGGFTATILGGALLVYRATLEEAEELFDFHMEEVAGLLAAGAPAAGRYVPSPGAGGIEERLELSIRIETRTGEVLHAAGHWPPEAPRAAGFHDFAHGGTAYRAFVRLDPERAVRVVQSRSARNQLARNLAVDALFPLLLMAPLVVAGAWWVVRVSFAPIDRTRAQIASRPASDLTPLPSGGLPHEVAPLVDEINQLFARVQGALAAQAGFIADAAHELRTPMAALRVQAQSVQKAADPAAREVALRRLLAGMDRATRLMEQMLALARQDVSAAAAHGPWEPVGLRALMRDVLMGLAALSADKDIDMGLAEGPEATVTGQADGLRALMQNLVDNAIKYTPRGGTVDVAIGSDARGAWIRVEDSGPGIAPADRARAFDRFCRIGGHDATGSGLGLSIVDAVARRHGASVSLDRSAKLGGLRIDVAFPVLSGA